MWWLIIAAVLVTAISFFLLGLYVMLRNISNKITEIKTDVVKEVVKGTFNIIKDKIKK